MVRRSVMICITILAILASTVSTKGTDLLFKAVYSHTEPTNHWETTPDYFSRVGFWCNTRARIHVNHLEISLAEYENSPKVKVCRDNDTRALIDTCEGKLGYCSMNLTASACRYHNQINVTFQCVTVYDIEGMCSDYSMNSTAGQPLRLFTPYYEDAYTYNSSRQCECVVTPDTGSAVAIKNLYVNLETKPEGGCYDYLQIDSGEVICNRSMPAMTNRTFSTDKSVSIKFYSDKSVQDRGASMMVQPDSPDGVVQIVCTGNSFNTSSAPEPHSVTFKIRGEDGPTDFTECVDAKCIDNVYLDCETNHVIHITKLDLSRSSNNCSTNADCRWISDEPIKSCEGKAGKCNFKVCSQTPLNCRHINKIDITFQCIPREKIFPMCPNTTTTITHDKPAYYITPRFTEVDGTYSDQTHCQCSVRSLDNRSVTATLLFADLDMFYSGYCNDYVGFDENDTIEKEYCNRTITNRLISKEFSSDEKSGFQFSSVLPIYEKRGAWFGIYPGMGSALVTCQNYIGPTTTFHTYTYPTYTSHIGIIVGLTSGGFVLLVVLVVSVSVYAYVRKSRQRKTHLQTSRNQSMLKVPVSIDHSVL